LFARRNGAIMKSDWSSKKERRCFHNIMITFDDVEKALARREPELLSCDNGTRAAVALILRQVPSGMQVLFIERASHDNDPWSGHIGFPGGKVEGIDQNPRMAAERETREEIGLDLREARRLGRLSEVAGATLPIRVSCFVYGIDRAGPLQLNEEVKDVFWVPLSWRFSRTLRGADIKPAGHPPSTGGKAGSVGINLSPCHGVPGTSVRL
jgi:8-oxo-dGTP pyrophosphatase MutT (NUDIX family)